MTRLAVKRSLPGTVPDPLYPDEDGRFMGDTDFHTSALRLLCDGLEDFFEPAPRVYVGMNLIYYYKKGDPSSRRDPDILVARGVGKHPRRSYRLWEEKVRPRVFFEISSKKTYRDDIGEKVELYESLKIVEYFLFDPEDRYLDPPFQGFRLVRGRYVKLVPDAEGGLISKELGLRLVPEQDMLCLYDLKTGRRIPTRTEKAEEERQGRLEADRRAEEERQRAVEASRHAETERQRALAANQLAEAERQRALAANQIAEVERQRALAANQIAEVERQRAAGEKQRADALEAELNRLREQLDERSRNS